MKVVQRIVGPCHELTDFPAKAFAFELENNDVCQLARCDGVMGGSFLTSRQKIEIFMLFLSSRNVCKLVTFLRDQEIAHNLFLTKGKPFVDVASSDSDSGTLRVFVWARESSFGKRRRMSM